jgi:hypothetical protein
VSLNDWLKNAWLTEHQSSRQEIADLLTVIDRDLKDCRSSNLSADWRLAIAYNAALQVALAGLAAEGYRVARESHHFRAIHSMTFTIGCDSAIVAQLDASRKKRNISDCETAGSVSNREASEMQDLAAVLRAKLLAWLGQEHPDLLP